MNIELEANYPSNENTPMNQTRLSTSLPINSSMSGVIPRRLSMYSLNTRGWMLAEIHVLLVCSWLSYC